MPAPVLLLSSDEQAVQVASQVLSELGFTVERPADASAAVKEIGVRLCSALLVDCDDVIAGKLVFEALRGSKANQGIPAIAIVSGRTSLPNAFRLGAEFIVTKPASLDQARHTIRAAMSRTLKKEPAFVQPMQAPPQPAQANAAVASATPVSPAAPPVHSDSPDVPATQPARTSAKASPVAPQRASSAAAAAPAFAPAATTPFKSPASVEKPITRSKSDDPVLAELDELENPIPFSAPPFTKLRLKRRTPIVAFVLVMLLLGAAGGYYAFMMRPDFRNLVMFEYARFRTLIGKPLPQPVPVSRPTPPRPAVPTAVPEPTPGITEPSAAESPSSSTSAPQNGALETQEMSKPAQARPAAGQPNPQH